MSDNDQGANAARGCLGALHGSRWRQCVGPDLAGVVAISSPWVTSGMLRVNREDVARLTIPKLFVTTENDKYTGIGRVTLTC